MTATAARVAAAASGSQQGKRQLFLLCAQCHAALGSLTFGTPAPLTPRLVCPQCQLCLVHDRGIWVALAPERLLYYDRFLKDYQIVRSEEGRGSDSADYYLALPFKDLTGRNQAQWSIRARTFRCFERTVLPEIEWRANRPLLVLDLGAGNGWLSYRLALRGHLPVAVDLQTGDTDGLGAASHYLQTLPGLFPRFQAEHDRLPFAAAQFDCAIYNASFHYSENFVRTLGEAVRCLRPGGTVVIADSPWYNSAGSGEQMVQERRAAFQKRFGFPSDALASLEYLTDERLAALEDFFNINWRIDEPGYGLRWALSPLVARWKNSREPSRFRIHSAQVNAK